MANGKDLELALRIRADLSQGQAALAQLGQSVQDVGQHAAATGQQLASVGESAEQQAQRLQAMIAASLQNSAAQDAMTASAQRLSAAVQAGNATWQANAAAQSEVMNTYHNAERAQSDRAAAEQKAAQEAAKVTAETGKQDIALRKLLGAINSSEKALNRLDSQEAELTEHYKRGALAVEDYEQSLKSLADQRAELEGLGDDAEDAASGANSATDAFGGLKALLVAGIAGYSLKELAADVLETNKQWQQAEFTMQAATGSAELAAKELTYVTEVSNKLGLELMSTSQSYAGLVAAAKETPALAAQIHGIFEGIAEASTVLHLAPDQTSSVLGAYVKMISTGKVQLEQLQQLSTHIPGTFDIAAKSLGTNTAELSKWLEKGLVPAAEFLPRFSAALHDAFGETAQAAAGELQGELNRLTNVWTELKLEAGDAGFIDSFTGAVRSLGEVLKDPAFRDGLNVLVTGMGKLTEYSAKGIVGLANITRFAAEEIAARANGPAGDDPVRVEDAIARETEALRSAQENYLKAIDGGYRQGIVDDFERKMQVAQVELDRLTQLQQTFAELQSGENSGSPPATTPSTPTPTPFKPAGVDTAAINLAKQNDTWVKQLEKEAATYGKSKAATREYELEQRGLTGTLKARAEAAWVMLDSAEKQKQADEQAKKDTKTLAQLNLDLLKATGQNVDAAGAEIEKKYGALQKRLTAAGDTKGAGLVTQLMGIEQAKAELSDLEQSLDRVFSEQARREQSISTQQQAGLISELGARQQILDLNKLTAAQVEKLLPSMRELAAVTGDPAAIERVKDLEVRLGALRTVANEVSNALKAGFETGLSGALEGLASGTMNLQEAATSFVQSIASSMAQLASQQLAAMATDGLGGLLGGAQEATGLTMGATAVTSSAGALTAAGGTLITGAAAITSAAGILAAAGATNATSSAVSTAVGYTGAFGFATGGRVTGPGTGTSDSIAAWLSNEEFVTRAAVVTQPGALGFLHDFNARGMSALDDWALRVRHSTGGLAGVPAPAMPRPSMGTGRLAEPAAAMSSTLTNQQAFYLLDDPSRMAEAISSKAGQEAVVVMMSRDPAKFRSILKLQG